MDATKDRQKIDELIDNTELKDKIIRAAPEVLVEILYEYLSQNISTHFQKTVEGIDSIHTALLERQLEHSRLAQRLESIETRLATIEKALAAVADRLPRH